MKTTGDEFFYNVKALFVPPDEVEDSILDSTEEFIDEISDVSEELKKDVERSRMSHFIANMERVLAWLKDMYAKNLEADAASVLMAAKLGSQSELRSLLKPFVAEMIALSIELQMAQEEVEGQSKKETSAIEKYTDIINSLKAVARSLEKNNMMEGYRIVGNMKATDPQIKTLSDHLHLGQKRKALDLCQKVSQFYKQKIKDLEGSEGTAKTILAVDDRPEILSTLAGVLDGYYHVIGVTSGKAALGVLEKQKPDLFILDIVMPEMDGFELAENIRNMPDFADTPLLFLTSNATRENFAMARKSGCSDFIVKPVNQDTMLAKISHHTQ